MDAILTDNNGAVMAQNGLESTNQPQQVAIDAKAIQDAIQRLNEYRAGKAKLEKKLIKNEQYWKLRQWDYMDDVVSKNEPKVATAWLWNCITAKHADMVDAFPESNIRPKRADDVPEAEKLRSIIPVIFTENDYEETYDRLCTYMLKQGGCCAGVFWDGSKHEGLGDISIKKIDFLELFWQAGITDIQDSREVFYCKYEDNDKLLAKYPQLVNKIGGKQIYKADYKADDNIDTSKKTIVVDWYYKKVDGNGDEVLHFAKFVNTELLFSSENEPDKYPNGWYDHGLYPFVTASLFDVENSLVGYSYTDIGRGDQNAIDQITTAIMTNAVASSRPRYFTRIDGNINEDEFADFSNSFVHIQGSLDDTSIKEVAQHPLPAYVVEMRDRLIEEMKESLSNRDVNNGGSVSGVTAASAIAAMQEQGGKMSKAHNREMYRLHKRITDMTIELIRQFYDVPREFRITGKMGEDKFVQYSNQMLKPQPQPSVMGMEMGLRLPCFDIEVNAQKQSAYSKIAQNELSIQLYQLGIFDPHNVDPALALLQIMDFDHKDDVIQIVQRNADLMMKYQKLQQIAFQMAQLVDPAMAEQLAQAISIEQGNSTQMGTGSNEEVSMTEVNADGSIKGEEHPFVQKARMQAQQASEI